MKEVSAVLITFNEEEKVGKALRSLIGLVDEVVIIDSESSDGTERICRKYTQRFIRRPWEGYRQQKQYATDQAAHDWVLSLDADETLSPELQQELLEWKRQDEDGNSGYYLPRKTFFLGRWIEHTTWFPDWQLRLFRKDRGAWQGGRIHESFRVEDGPTSRFSHCIEHYTYSTLSEYLSQLERFSSLAAADYYDRGLRANWKHLTLHPLVALLSNYFVHRGFLDGVPGLAASAVSSISVFFKYLKLWELQSRSSQCAEK